MELVLLSYLYEISRGQTQVISQHSKYLYPWNCLTGPIDRFIDYPYVYESLHTSSLRRPEHVGTGSRTLVLWKTSQ